MAETTDGEGLSSIHCNARNVGGYRVEALSDNTGSGFVTLVCAKKLVERGAGCQGSVVSFPAQSKSAQADVYKNLNPNKWLLFTHPTYKSKRIHLGVYVSKSPKDPYAWSNLWIIYNGPSGYSDLAYMDDGWFVCLIERGLEKETEQTASVLFRYNEVRKGTGGWKVSSLCVVGLGRLPVFVWHYLQKTFRVLQVLSVADWITACLENIYNASANWV